MSSETHHDSDEMRVIWLTSGSHFMTHGFMTLFSAVMVVIAGENSMSFMEIGVIANVGYFLYGLGGIPAGYMADRFGAKQVLTVGVLGMSISSIMVGMSYGMWPFAVSYALLGLFASIHHPAGLSFIARGVGSRRGKAMGIHGVFGNLGLFLAPMAGAGCIWLFSSWRAPYLVYGVMGLIFGLILHRAEVPGEANLSLSAMVRRRSGKERGESVIAASPKGTSGEGSLVPVALILLLVGSVLSGFIFRGSLTFLPALLRQEVRFVTNHDFPVVMAGYLTTGVLSFGLIGAWFGGYI
ncbi:MAG: MFS transporter, partial [Desulfobulbaceae bacterium]|nr:MFS transporter [Desulfobulbaceae bacterium]